MPFRADNRRVVILTQLTRGPIEVHAAERPDPPLSDDGPGLATRTPTSEVPMTDSAHSMNLRGARLGVSFTEGHEAVVSRASLS